ncbi:MAG: hypothetical protein OXN97_20660 [Bryobacterales bacterium]|nr:hypothetical protein [Bryobacterales bacterium]
MAGFLVRLAAVLGTPNTPEYQHCRAPIRESGACELPALRKGGFRNHAFRKGLAVLADSADDAHAARQHERRTRPFEEFQEFQVSTKAMRSISAMDSAEQCRMDDAPLKMVAK